MPPAPASPHAALSSDPADSPAHSQAVSVADDALVLPVTSGGGFDSSTAGTAGVTAASIFTAGSGVTSSQAVDTAVDAIAPSVTAAAMNASFATQEIVTGLPGMLLPPTESVVLPVQSASSISISVAPSICVAMVAAPGGISDAASCALEYTEAQISPITVAGVPLPPTCTVAQIPSVAAHSHAATVAPSISDSGAPVVACNEQTLPASTVPVISCATSLHTLAVDFVAAAGVGVERVTATSHAASLQQPLLSSTDVLLQEPPDSPPAMGYDVPDKGVLVQGSQAGMSLPLLLSIRKAFAFSQLTQHSSPQFDLCASCYAQSSFFNASDSKGCLLDLQAAFMSGRDMRKRRTMTQLWWWVSSTIHCTHTHSGLDPWHDFNQRTCLMMMWFVVFWDHCS